MNYKIWVLLAAAAAGLASAAAARGDSLPPESYEKSSYVDERGCAYGRVTVGGWQVWVQRLDEERRPVCGLEPTRFRSGEQASAVAKGRT